MIEAILLIFAADGGAVVTSPAPLVEPDPKAMTAKQIREFNATVPRSHPFYIRCVSSLETGSLVKKTYSCRTNRQWAIAHDQGNQNAREIQDAMASKFWSTN